MYLHVNLSKGHFLERNPPAAASAGAATATQTTPGLQRAKRVTRSQEGKCKIKRYYAYILYVHFICTINMYILHVQIREKRSRQKRRYWRASRKARDLVQVDAFVQHQKKPKQNV